MTSPSGEADKKTCQNSTVLVVEDDPLARIALAEHLRGIGYRVIEAGSADDAISALSSGSRVNVVFADVELPGSMGGFSLAVWVRNHYRLIPVILTSGVGAVIPPLNRQHVVPFLEKPYRPEEAAELIARVLSSSSLADRPD